MIHFKKVRQKRPPITKRKKSQAGQDALDKLNSFLDAETPEPVEFLTRMWDDQQKAITYKELKAAIRNGYMTIQMLEDWQQDYNIFVNEHLLEHYYNAMESAAGHITEMAGNAFKYDPMWQGITDWVEARTAKLVTNVTTESQDAISALVARAFRSGESADSLSRVIRPCIGLTRPQADANMNYYEKMKQWLMDNTPGIKESTAEKRAQEAAAQYAVRQHRYRAQVIAETELAMAYNEGEYQAVKQAQAKGYLGTCVKVWSTAADELVCPTCGDLEGTIIDIDDRFRIEVGKRVSFSMVPPAHPQCRCAYEVREVEPPANIPAEEPQEMSQNEQNQTSVGVQQPSTQNPTSGEEKSQEGLINPAEHEEPELKYDDITEEWRENYVKNTPIVENAKEYHAPGGMVYKDTDPDAIFDHDDDEKATANLLSRVTGQKVELCFRINGKKTEINTPDYLLGEKQTRWDRKGLKGGSKDNLRNASKDCKDQAENFIFDVTNAAYPDDVAKQAQLAFGRHNMDFVDSIAVIRGDEILAVYKRK